MTGILKVDTIQSSGGTTGLTIDSSGRVLQPAKPAFRVEKRASNQDGSGVQKITFEHVAFDVGNNYDTSNSRFVVPVDGIYFFQSTLRFVADADTLDYAKHVVRVNNAEAADLFQFNVRPDYMRNSHLNGSTLLQLTANQYVEIFSEMSGTNPLIHASSDGRRTYFTGFLVG